MITNYIEVTKNNNDDNDETMVGDHMVQMVNDVYWCFSKNWDLNCDNRKTTSMNEMDDINKYHKLIKDAHKPLKWMILIYIIS